MTKHLLQSSFMLTSVLMLAQAHATPMTEVTWFKQGGDIVKQVASTTIDLLALFNNAPKLNKADLTYTATNKSLEWTLIGGDLAHDAEETFSILAQDVKQEGGVTITTKLWQFKFTILEEATFFPVKEYVSANGFAQHLIAPHAGEEQFGPQLSYNLLWNAGDQELTLQKSGKHPGGDHIDKLGLDLNGTSKGNDILGYTFQGSARHVPEPSSLLLVGIGLALLLSVGLSRSRSACSCARLRS